MGHKSSAQASLGMPGNNKVLGSPHHWVESGSSVAGASGQGRLFQFTPQWGTNFQPGMGSGGSCLHPPSQFHPGLGVYMAWSEGHGVTGWEPWGNFPSLECWGWVTHQVWQAAGVTFRLFKPVSQPGFRPWGWPGGTASLNNRQGYSKVRATSLGSCLSQQWARSLLLQLQGAGVG